MNTDIPLPMPSLLDGATATELQKVGMPPEACTGHWVLEHPEALLELQCSYVAAGSQLLTAPTFGCSPASLAAFGLFLLLVFRVTILHEYRPKQR